MPSSARVRPNALVRPTASTASSPPLEAMREAERDPALRERLGALLGQYRRVMVETVRADQERGAVFAGAPPEALATLLAAAGDGLLLYVLLDPDLDVDAVLAALRALLHEV